jgi:hypothetical protein
MSRFDGGNSAARKSIVLEKGKVTVTTSHHEIGVTAGVHVTNFIRTKIFSKGMFPARRS